MPDLPEKTAPVPGMTLIADASWCGVSRVGGWGAWIASDKARWRGGNAFRGLMENSSVCELCALVNGLHQARSLGILRPGMWIVVQTDSYAAIRALEGTRVTMIDRERDAVEAWRDILGEEIYNISIKHVKGHANTGGKGWNASKRFVAQQWCDQTARYYMRRARDALYAQAKEGQVNGENGNVGQQA